MSQKLLLLTRCIFISYILILSSRRLCSLPHMQVYIFAPATENRGRRRQKHASGKKTQQRCVVSEIATRLLEMMHRPGREKFHVGTFSVSVSQKTKTTASNVTQPKEFQSGAAEEERNRKYSHFKDAGIREYWHLSWNLIIRMLAD